MIYLSSTQGATVKKEKNRQFLKRALIMDGNIRNKDAQCKYREWLNLVFETKRATLEGSDLKSSLIIKFIKGRDR